MAGPLEGLRIVDMSTVLMGPYATQILGDWGADVVKVEPPSGDVSRSLGPGRSPGMGPTFLHLNRNKRSIVLDAKSPAARAVFDRLLRSADVFVSNLRDEALRRLGLGREALAELNPRLIAVSLTGYGEGGVYSGRPAYDDLVQGQAAIPDLIRRAGGGDPRYVPLPLVDRLVGVRAAGAILAGVVARSRTGRGQHLELPMFETMAEFVLADHLQGASYDPPTGDPGYVRLLAGERRPFPTRDGYVCVLVYTDRQWRDFLGAIGEWERYRDDPRFKSLATRTRHTSEVYGILAQMLCQRSTAEWLDLCARIDVPAAPLNDLQSLIDDPHLRSVGFFQPVEHPTEGRMVQMAIPERWSDTPAEVRRQAPRLGADAAAVLGELGYTPDEIDALTASGAVGAAGAVATK